MTPEEFLSELAGQLMPGFHQIGENLKTINANFEMLFDQMQRDNAQIKANFDAVYRDLLTTQKNIETTHGSIVELRAETKDLLEITRSHERRLGLLETEAPTQPIRRGGS